MCRVAGLESGSDCLTSSVFSREWSVAEESPSGGKVKLRGRLEG